MNTRRPQQISDEQLRHALTRLPDRQRMAEDLAFILAGVERTRQRRALPARLTGRTLRMRRVAVLLAVLAVLAALGIALILVVGSRHRLPPPFGVARPGLIAFDLRGDIYVTSPDGTRRTQLTSGPDLDSGVAWSPDGTMIAYKSRLADQSTAIIGIDADGRHRITLADHLAEAGNLGWSPDSRRVAFGARTVGSGSFHIYTAAVDQPGAIQFGPPDLFGVDPSWSPDGQQIVFKRIYSYGAGAQQGSAPDGLWLIGADGSNAHALSDATGLGNRFFNTAWSPDGEQVAFMADGVGAKSDVFVINADGSDQRNISNSPEDEYWPSWSPDGTRIAFARMSLTQTNAGTLIVEDPDGSHSSTLKGPLVNSNTPVWSPDAMHLLGYAKNQDQTVDSNSAIAVFDPSGRAPPLLIPVVDFNSAAWQRLAP